MEMRTRTNSASDRHRAISVPRGTRALLSFICALAVSGVVSTAVAGDESNEPLEPPGGTSVVDDEVPGAPADEAEDSPTPGGACFVGRAWPLCTSVTLIELTTYYGEPVQGTAELGVMVNRSNGHGVGISVGGLGMEGDVEGTAIDSLIVKGRYRYWLGNYIGIDAIVSWMTKDISGASAEIGLTLADMVGVSAGLRALVAPDHARGLHPTVAVRFSLVPVFALIGTALHMLVLFK
jgi:hypothetical protein